MGGIRLHGFSGFLSIFSNAGKEQQILPAFHLVGIARSTLIF